MFYINNYNKISINIHNILIISAKLTKHSLSHPFGFGCKYTTIF